MVERASSPPRRTPSTHHPANHPQPIPTPHHQILTVPQHRPRQPPIRPIPTPMLHPRRRMKQATRDHFPRRKLHFKYRRHRYLKSIPARYLQHVRAPRLVPVHLRQVQRRPQDRQQWRCMTDHHGARLPPPTQPLRQPPRHPHTHLVQPLGAMPLPQVAHHLRRQLQPRPQPLRCLPRPHQRRTVYRRHPIRPHHHRRLLHLRKTDLRQRRPRPFITRLGAAIIRQPVPYQQQPPRPTPQAAHSFRLIASPNPRPRLR